MRLWLEVEVGSRRGIVFTEGFTHIYQIDIHHLLKRHSQQVLEPVLNSELRLQGL